MTDQYLTLRNTRIRYHDTGGAGSVVMLFHGIGGSLELWSRQLDAPGPLRLIALDLPGHGLSDLDAAPNDLDSFARTALDFADALGLERFAVAGNSMGGAVALRVAGLAVERVSHVVVVSGAALGRETFFPFRLMILPGLGEVMMKPSPAAVDRQISGIVKDPARCMTPDLRAAITRNTYKPGGAGAFLATLRRMTTLGGQRRQAVETSQALIRDLKMPLLFLHGRDDTIIPARHSTEAAALNPAARVELLDDCGHTAQVEQPALFNARLAGFVLG